MGKQICLHFASEFGVPTWFRRRKALLANDFRPKYLGRQDVAIVNHYPVWGYVDVKSHPYGRVGGWVAPRSRQHIEYVRLQDSPNPLFQIVTPRLCGGDGVWCCGGVWCFRCPWLPVAPHPPTMTA